MKEKAKSVYMSAMNLVQILFPKNLSNTGNVQSTKLNNARDLKCN